MKPTNIELQRDLIIYQIETHKKNMQAFHALACKAMRNDLPEAMDALRKHVISASESVKILTIQLDRL